MLIKTDRISTAIDIASVEGVAPARQSFLCADALQEELVSPEALNGNWTGTRRQALEGDELVALPPTTEQLLGELAYTAVQSGFPDWEANYMMAVLTTEGFREHPDSTYFRNFSIFAYWLGRTDFYYRQNNGKARGPFSLFAGDILVMRQSLNSADESTRVPHGVAASGLRGFLMVGSQQIGESIYPVTRQEVQEASVYSTYLN